MSEKSEPTAPEHRAIYLTGPTASGKSAVGVELARLLDAEILALDSMTLYRGMDVGTAKTTMSERGGVPHHLIDVLDPWESASVAQYRGWAIEAIRDVESRGRRALFVGGTALYLKAMLRGLFEGPGADPVVRERLEAEAESQGDVGLHARLATLDPATAARLHPNDRRRIVRALEVIELTGTAFSALQRQHERPASGVRVFALELPRPVLYDRINRRVSAMFDAGLVDEVRRLQAAPKPLSGVAAQGVGYSEVIAHLEGGPGLDRTIDLIQIRTRQFAKRQGTWFRGLAEVAPLAMEPGEPAEAVAKRIAARIEGGGEG